MYIFPSRSLPVDLHVEDLEEVGLSGVRWHCVMGLVFTESAPLELAMHACTHNRKIEIHLEGESLKTLGASV